MFELERRGECKTRDLKQRAFDRLRHRTFSPAVNRFSSEPDTYSGLQFIHFDNALVGFNLRLRLAVS